MARSSLPAAAVLSLLLVAGAAQAAGGHSPAKKSAKKAAKKGGGSASAGSACGAVAFSPVADGVEGGQTTCRNGQVDAFVLKVHLGQGAAIHVNNPPPLSTPAAFARRIHAVAAVNGGLFKDDQRPFLTVGPARSNGQHVRQHPTSFISSGIFGADATHAEIRFGPHGGRVASSAAANHLIQPWMREAVSGHTAIVEGGQACTGLCHCAQGHGAEFCTSPGHARTGIGVSADGHTVYIAVASGAWNRGLSLPQLGGLLAGVGADKALNLDGGHSSTFWFNGHDLNNVPGGHETSVSTIVAVTAANPREWPGHASARSGGSGSRRH